MLLLMFMLLIASKSKVFVVKIFIIFSYNFACFVALQTPCYATESLTRPRIRPTEILAYNTL